MSISGLFYVIGGQYLMGKLWHWFPISGYQPGLDAWKFMVMPVLVSLIGGIGDSSRFYRALFIEEIGKDYVRTARAKGLSDLRVLFKHVLGNAMIPILTGVVVVIPRLFMGSLIIESFFGIPGLGSYTIDAIQAQDFAIVRSMVFLGSLLYIVGLVLTDISYTLGGPAREAGMIKPVLLWSDALILLLLATVAAADLARAQQRDVPRTLAAGHGQPWGPLPP
jgi:peptide/nickel transport system permease protein